MSLRRNYESSSKYLYAKIINVFYQKDLPLDITIEMWEKDDADELHNVKLGGNHNYRASHPETNDPFAIEALNVADMNIIKSCYNYIKANIDLFRDFIDC